MKKSLLSLAVLSAISFGASAGVELYGTLDVAVATVAQVPGGFGSSSSPTGGVDIADPIAANPSTSALIPTTSSATGLINGGISQSRWGIKGSEDIDSDLSAIFKLEGCIDPTKGGVCNAIPNMLSGAVIGTSAATAGAYYYNFQHASSADGQLFGREATVGLKSKELGQITFGRNNVLGADVYNAYAPAQNAQQFTPTGYSGTLGGSGGETEAGRLDNSFKYTVKNGDFNAGLIYGFGNTAGSTTAGSAYQINLGYENNKFGVQAVYSSMHDVMKGDPAVYSAASGNVAANTPSANTIKATFFDTRAYMILAKYKFNDQFTGRIGIQRFTLSAPSDLTNDAAITSYYGYTISQYAQVALPQSQTLSHIGLDYHATEKLEFDVGYFSRTYGTYASPASPTSTQFFNASTSSSGLTANFVSALLDYKLSNRSDIYAGAMTATFGGVSTAYQNNSIVALGLRHKF